MLVLIWPVDGVKIILCVLKATTLGEKEVVAVPLGAHRFLLSPTEEPTVNPEEARATSPVCRCPPDNHQPVRIQHTHTHCFSFHLSIFNQILDLFF